MPIRCYNKQNTIITCPLGPELEANCQFLNFDPQGFEVYQCNIAIPTTPSIVAPTTTPRTGGAPNVFDFLLPAIMIVIGLICIFKLFK